MGQSLPMQKIAPCKPTRFESVDVGTIRNSQTLSPRILASVSNPSPVNADVRTEAEKLSIVEAVAKLVVVIVV